MLDRSHQRLKSLFSPLKAEDGNIESSLVLIPLLLLFLAGMQLVGTLYLRNNSITIAQNQASTRAISGSFLSSDTFIKIAPTDGSRGLDLLVAHESSFLPKIFPHLVALIGRDSSIEVSGIAVIENAR